MAVYRVQKKMVWDPSVPTAPIRDSFWVVERRFLWYFWITVKRFETYCNAKKWVNEKNNKGLD